MPLRSSEMRPSTMSRMLVELNSFGDASFRGRLYSPYLGKGADFSSFVEMTEIMDKIFDFWAYPAAITPYHQPKAKRKKKEAPAVDPDALLHDGAVDENGERVFSVHVLFRRNADWQGKLTPPHSKEEVRFQSTLQMLRLFEEYFAGNA